MFAFATVTTASSARRARPAATQPAASGSATEALKGIHKIRHVVIIMQENRSFDNYFGTYPGADGIPRLRGHRGKVPWSPLPWRPRRSAVKLARPFRRGAKASEQ